MHQLKVLPATERRDYLGGRIAHAPLSGCEEFPGTSALAEAGAMAQTRTMEGAGRYARLASRWRGCTVTDPGPVIRLAVLVCAVHAVPAYAAQCPCAAIRQLCEDAGFVQGAAQSGNGLQRDCIQPIMRATPAPGGEASPPVPRVDRQLVAACKAAVPDFGQAGDKPKLPRPSGAQASSGEVSESAGSPSGATRGVTLYVPGSTQKINQLLGELDKQTHQPTLSRTESRYRLQGTDLGYSFEHQGKIYFLFGDTVGARNSALDSMTTSADASVDPERGVRLDFLTQSPGLYLTVQPPGISMGAFEVPTAGLSLNGQIYVIVDTEHSGGLAHRSRRADPGQLPDHPERISALAHDLASPGRQIHKNVAAHPAGRDSRLAGWRAIRTDLGYRVLPAQLALSVHRTGGAV
jgi:hypothetical protein